MLLSLGAVLLGLVLLIYSADKFIGGSAFIARYFGLSPFLVGIIIVGFGTSAPELVVSVFAAVEGVPGIALGNAYGSNIINIGLILGLSALLRPICVGKSVLTRDLPILSAVTGLAIYQIIDMNISRFDALILIVVLFIVMGWNAMKGFKNADASDDEDESPSDMTPRRAFIQLFFGLAVLVASSRMLVWGAVHIARDFGVSEVIIGLTIVAAGTSLPELASSLAAVRKNHHDIVLGNIIGSNLFNTLAVVGLAGIITPMNVDFKILQRDIPVMAILTLMLFLPALSRSKEGKLGRKSGVFMVAVYFIYTGYLISEVLVN